MLIGRFLFLGMLWQKNGREQKIGPLGHGPLGQPCARNRVFEDLKNLQ